jgi:hypothetical protein
MIKMLKKINQRLRRTETPNNKKSYTQEYKKYLKLNIKGGL